MTTARENATAKRDIRALIDGWVEATLAKDIDRIMSCYASDVRAFDAILELEFKGADAYRKHWENCITFMQGEMIFEIHDLEIAARDDLALCHYLARCGCTDEKGEMKAGWLRGTVGCQKIGGNWRIVHEHYSVPFDPMSGKVLDKKPEQAEQSSAA